MSSNRPHALIVVTGRKFAGKSYTTFGMLLDIMQGDYANGVPPRNVLIFDPNNEYGLVDFNQKKFIVRTIDIKHVSWYAEHKKQGQIRRIVPIDENGKPLGLTERAEMLFKILDTFANGVLLCEDINKYVQTAMPMDFVDRITSNRHVNMDIILHYQSVGDPPPRVWSNCTWYRMHKDSVGGRRHRDKFPEKFHCFMIAERLINSRVFKAEDDYRSGKISEQEYKAGKAFYVWIDTELLRIGSGRSAFTKKEARQAVLNQISEFKADMLRQFTTAVDEDNGFKKKYKTDADAFNAALEYYMLTHFDPDTLVDEVEVEIVPQNNLLESPKQTNLLEPPTNQ